MTQQMQEIILRWAESLETFVYEALQAKPSSQQLAVIRDIDAGEIRISIKSGHGTGKTSLLSWVILWVGLFKRDAKIPCTAPTAPQLRRLLLPEAKKWRESLPTELQDIITVKTDSIEFRATGNVSVARTARKESPESLQGFHASFLFWVVDEASGVPDLIFEVIDGSLTGGNDLVILAANPTRTDGYFYDTHNKNKALWKTHTFNAEESENVTKESIERKKKQYGEDSDACRVRVQGKFPRANNKAVIPLHLLEDAIHRVDYNDYGAEAWGVDYADAGDDRTILAKRIGNYIYEIKECHITGSHRQSQTASWIANEWLKAKRKPQAIFIDAIGEGSGVVSRLNDADFAQIPVIPVKASSKSSKPEYFNKRAELYYQVKEVLEDEGKIIDDDELVGELTAHEFEITTNGLLKIISKDEVKEKLGRSPDKAEAVILCCNPVIYNEEELELEYETPKEVFEGEIGGW